MGNTMVSLRLDDELLEWATAYAKERGVPRTQLLSAAIEQFRKDCESGVPELRATARRQSSVKSEGVGECPKNAGGHVWVSQEVDSRRPCKFCGRPGRDNKDQTGGFLAQATMERSELFARLRTPASAHGGKPKEPKGVRPVTPLGPPSQNGQS